MNFGHFPLQCNNMNNHIEKTHTHTHMIMQKHLTSKSCYLLSMTFTTLFHPQCQQHPCSKKKQNVPKNLHHCEYTPSTLLFHKSTITPLNDKNQTNIFFWGLDIDMAFLVHILNPNSEIPDTILNYIGLTYKWNLKSSLGFQKKHLVLDLKNKSNSNLFLHNLK